MTDEANRFAKGVKRVVGDGAAVDQHLTAVGRVVAHEQLENRGFARTRVAHHAEEFTLANGERNSVEHLDGGVGISEVDVVELDVLDAAFEGHSILAVDDGGFKINGSEHTASGGLTPLELVDKDAEDEHRHGHSGADEQERDELTGGDLSLAGKVPTGRRQQTEGHTGDGVNHRNEAVAVLAGAHRLVSVGA